MTQSLVIAGILLEVQYHENLRQWSAYACVPGQPPGTPNHHAYNYEREKACKEAFNLVAARLSKRERWDDPLLPGRDDDLLAMIDTADQIKATIDAQRERHDAEQQRLAESSKDSPFPHEPHPIEAQLDMHGRPVLADLLAARAHLLIAIAQAKRDG